MLFTVRWFAVASLAWIVIAILDVRLVDARPAIQSARQKRLERPFLGDAALRRRHVELTPAQRRRLETRKRQVSSDAFCQSFAQDCYNVALQGKAPGQVTVTRSCQRSGTSKTSSYSFGCQVDGRDMTSTVLNAMGNRVTVTVPTTAVEMRVQRVVATNVVQQFLPITAVVPTTTTAIQRVSLTSNIQQLIAQTLVLPPTTTTALQRINVTSLVQQVVSQTTLLPTATSLVQNIVTVSSNAGTTTSTKVSLGSYTVPVVQIAVRDVSALQRRASSNTPFCKTFTASCKTACSSARSSVTTNTCSQKSSTSYSLTCYCRSKKSVVDAALANVASKFSLPQQVFQTVAVQTNVVYSTDVVTQTVTRPTVVATNMPVVTVATTATAIVPVTIASTTIVATTKPVVTVATTSTATVLTTSTRTSVVATSKPVVTASTTITSVVPLFATSTTEIILTPTGRVGIRTTDGATDGGYLAPGSPSTFFTTSIVYPYNAGTVFMAVRDVTSNAFKLRVADGSNDELVIEVGFGSDGQDFYAGSASFGFAERAPPGTCGSASVKAGTADGQGVLYGNVCASYVFQPSYVNTTAVLRNTVRLEPHWYNAGNVLGSPLWTFEQTGYALGLSGDPALFGQESNEDVYPVYLTFPV